MWFWNRREIYIGYSMKDFSNLRDTLISAGIRYDYKTFNQNTSSNRIRFGGFGLNPLYELQYYLYVHRKDFDRVQYLLYNKD